MESVKAFKRKILLWANNWFQEDQQSTEENAKFTPDAVEIARLLLATGFRVRFMDRCLPKQMHPVPDVPAESPACRVILMCPKSGFRIELDAPTSSCKCPTADFGLGHSWAIDEMDSEKMEEAVNSTVPRSSNEISKCVCELIAQLFHVMNMFPDQNHNETKETVAASLPSKISMMQLGSVKSEDIVSGSPMKTPTSGIAVVTPNAPCIAKGSPGDGKNSVLGRYRSLDTLIAARGFQDDLPEPGQLTPKEDSKSEKDMEVDNDPNATLVQCPSAAKKKFISKSSPALQYTERFQRADTFVFDDEEVNDVTNENGKRTLIRSNTYVSDGSAIKVDDEPRAGPPPKRTPSPLPLPSVSQGAMVLDKLQNIQQALSEVILMVAGNEKILSNIGDVSKASKAAASAVQQKISDNLVRPIRCLSDFGSVPNLTRAATTVRATPRPNIRRYATTIAAPATPTTSRRGTVSTATLSVAKKSTTTLVLPTGTASKTAMTSRPSASRLSSSSISQRFSTSPSLTSITSSYKDKDPSPATRRITPNRKFAHIQSSIPKPASNARK